MCAKGGVEMPGVTLVKWQGCTGVQVAQLLGNSPCAGSLLCAPIAQQVVCNKLWLFVCLKGNLRLDGGHPQDGDWVVASPGTSLI